MPARKRKASGSLHLRRSTRIISQAKLQLLTPSKNSATSAPLNEEAANSFRDAVEGSNSSAGTDLVNNASSQPSSINREIMSSLNPTMKKRSSLNPNDDKNDEETLALERKRAKSYHERIPHEKMDASISPTSNTSTFNKKNRSRSNKKSSKSKPLDPSNLETKSQILSTSSNEDIPRKSTSLEIKENHIIYAECNNKNIDQNNFTKSFENQFRNCQSVEENSVSHFDGCNICNNSNNELETEHQNYNLFEHDLSTSVNSIKDGCKRDPLNVDSNEESGNSCSDNGSTSRQTNCENEDNESNKCCSNLKSYEKKSLSKDVTKVKFQKKPTPSSGKSKSKSRSKKSHLLEEKRTVANPDSSESKTNLKLSVQIPDNDCVRENPINKSIGPSSTKTSKTEAKSSSEREKSKTSKSDLNKNKRGKGNVASANSNINSDMNHVEANTSDSGETATSSDPTGGGHFSSSDIFSNNNGISPIILDAFDPHDSFRIESKKKDYSTVATSSKKSKSTSAESRGRSNVRDSYNYGQIKEDVQEKLENHTDEIVDKEKVVINESIDNPKMLEISKKRSRHESSKNNVKKVVPEMENVSENTKMVRKSHSSKSDKKKFSELIESKIKDDLVSPENYKVVRNILKENVCKSVDVDPGQNNPTLQTQDNEESKQLVIDSDTTLSKHSETNSSQYITSKTSELSIDKIQETSNSDDSFSESKCFRKMKFQKRNKSSFNSISTSSSFSDHSENSVSSWEESNLEKPTNHFQIKNSISEKSISSQLKKLTKQSRNVNSPKKRNKLKLIKNKRIMRNTQPNSNKMKCKLFKKYPYKMKDENILKSMMNIGRIDQDNSLKVEGEYAFGNPYPRNEKQNYSMSKGSSVLKLFNQSDDLDDEVNDKCQEETVFYSKKEQIKKHLLEDDSMSSENINTRHVNEGDDSLNKCTIISSDSCKREVSDDSSDCKSDLDDSMEAESLSNECMTNEESCAISETHQEKAIDKLTYELRDSGSETSKSTDALHKEIDDNNTPDEELIFSDGADSQVAESPRFSSEDDNVSVNTGEISPLRKNDVAETSDSEGKSRRYSDASEPEITSCDESEFLDGSVNDGLNFRDEESMDVLELQTEDEVENVIVEKNSSVSNKNEQFQKIELEGKKEGKSRVGNKGGRGSQLQTASWSNAQDELVYDNEVMNDKGPITYLPTDLPIMEVFYKREALHGILGFDDGCDYLKILKSRKWLRESLICDTNNSQSSELLVKMLRPLCRDMLLRGSCKNQLLCSKKHEIRKECFNHMQIDDVLIVLDFVLKHASKVSECFMVAIFEFLGIYKAKSKILTLSSFVIKWDLTDLRYLKVIWSQLFVGLEACGLEKEEAMRSVIDHNITLISSLCSKKISKMVELWNLQSPSLKNCWYIIEPLTKIEGFVLEEAVLSKLLGEVLVMKSNDIRKIYQKIVSLILALPPNKLSLLSIRLVNDFLHKLKEKHLIKEAEALRERTSTYNLASYGSHSPDLSAPSKTNPFRRAMSVDQLADIKPDLSEDLFPNTSKPLKVYEEMKMQASLERAIECSNYAAIVSTIISCPKKCYIVNILTSTYNYIVKDDSLVKMKAILKEFKKSEQFEEYKLHFGSLIISCLVVFANTFQWELALDFLSLYDLFDIPMYEVKPLLSGGSYSPVRVAILYAEIYFYNKKYNNAIGIFINLKLIYPADQWKLNSTSDEDSNWIQLMVNFLLGKLVEIDVIDFATMFFKRVLDAQIRFDKPIKLNTYFEPLLFKLFDLSDTYPETPVKLYTRVCKKADVSLSGLAIRALLILAYKAKKTTIVSELFQKAIEEYAYPPFQERKNIILLYQSFTEEEMYVYITEWLRWFRIRLEKAGIGTAAHEVMIQFKSGYIEDFVVHKTLGTPVMLQEVDQSLQGAMKRLEKIITSKCFLDLKKTSRDTFHINPRSLQLLLDRIQIS